MKYVVALKKIMIQYMHKIKDMSSSYENYMNNSSWYQTLSNIHM
jgi:hypothetical protein